MYDIEQVMVVERINLDEHIETARGIVTFHHFWDFLQFLKDEIKRMAQAYLKQITDQYQALRNGIINDNPAVPIYDLYRQLSRTTTGSHVNIYNIGQYGSVYDNNMSDFFPK